MLKITEEQALDRLDVIPEKLQGLFFSPQTAQIIKSVCSANHVPKEKISDIAERTGLVILAFLHVEELPKEIEEATTLPPQVCKDIALSLNARLFDGVKSELQACFAPVPKEGVVKPIQSEARTISLSSFAPTTSIFKTGPKDLDIPPSSVLSPSPKPIAMQPAKIESKAAPTPAPQKAPSPIQAAKAPSPTPSKTSVPAPKPSVPPPMPLTAAPAPIFIRRQGEAAPLGAGIKESSLGSSQFQGSVQMPAPPKPAEVQIGGAKKQEKITGMVSTKDAEDKTFVRYSQLSAAPKPNGGVKTGPVSFSDLPVGTIKKVDSFSLSSFGMRAPSSGDGVSKKLAPMPPVPTPPPVPAQATRPPATPPPPAPSQEKKSEAEIPAAPKSKLGGFLSKILKADEEEVPENAKVINYSEEKQPAKAEVVANKPPMPVVATPPKPAAAPIPPPKPIQALKTEPIAIPQPPKATPPPLPPVRNAVVDLSRFS